MQKIIQTLENMVQKSDMDINSDSATSFIEIPKNICKSSETSTRILIYFLTPPNMKILYASRDLKTKEIQKFFIRDSKEDVDEDRTWFYYECEFEDNVYLEWFLQELQNKFPSLY